MTGIETSAYRKRLEEELGEVGSGGTDNQLGDTATATYDRELEEGLEEVGRAGEARTLVLEALPVSARVDARHVDSFPSPLAAASRRSISAPSMPVSATVLSREACPETIATSRSGTASVAARRRITAAFALPSSGGAETRTFHTVP